VRALKNCDVLIIIGNPSLRRKLKTLEEIARLIRTCYPSVRGLVYFDTSDGVGLIRPQILPHVDIYGMNQMLNDISYYQQKNYFESYLTNYYYANFFEDMSAIQEKRVAEHATCGGFSGEQLTKLRVLWNMGLGDWNIPRQFGRVGRFIKIISPITNYRTNITLYDQTPRVIHASLRASVPDKFRFFQRYRTLQLLEEIDEQHQFVLRYKGKVSFNEYKSEQRNSRVVVSPAGYGIICYRDFECFVNGAALLKPNMSHVVTWPDYYIEGETYIPYRWDFTDFGETFLDLVNSPDKCREIADKGQANFLGTFSAENGRRFAQRFSNLIQASIDAHTKNGQT
jgi:hypothetical protein